MLQSIRDRTQGWIAGTIVSLLILSFALWGIHSYFIGGSASMTVAEVNGVEITKGQLAVAYERLRRQMQSQFGSTNEMPGNVDAGLKDRALHALINIQVLKQGSIQQEYFVSPSQVDGFLENMPEFQVNGQFSVTRFQQALSTTMYTPNEFFDLIKTSLLIDQPRLGMIFSSFSLPNEVADMIMLVNQERDIEYVVIPYQNFSNQPITISDAQVQTYYQQHQDEFKTPEQVSVEYVELSVKDLMNKIQVTDDELKNFYNENTNTFAQPTQWKIDTIIVPFSGNATESDVTKASNTSNELFDKAKTGVDFTTLAKQYSLQYSSDASQKWITQNQVPTDLQKTLVMLTKTGDIVGPIRINNEFIILKAVDFKEAQLMPFDKVNDKVKEAYLHQKAEEKFAEMREKLANLAYEHPDSLQTASAELGLPIQTTELFSREKGGNDISSLNKIRDAAFSNDVLTLQNNSDVIQKNPDTAVVIHIKTHLPSSLLSLNAVRQQIVDKLRSNDVNAKTLHAAEEMKNKLVGSDPTQVMKSYNLTWNTLGYTSRHATTANSAILDTAFEMPKPVNKETFAIAKLPNGYAIIGLKAVQDGPINASDETDVYSEQIQNSQGLLEYELYKQSLMSQAKIVNE